MKKRKWIWIVLAAVLIVAVLTISNPQIRTNIFVRLYHEQIEEGLRINAGVPADDAVLFGYKYVNTWEQGYVLLDLYDWENPVVYDFDDGATYEIR